MLRRSEGARWLASSPITGTWSSLPAAPPRARTAREPHDGPSALQALQALGALKAEQPQRLCFDWPGRIVEDRRRPRRFFGSCHGPWRTRAHRLCDARSRAPAGRAPAPARAMLPQAISCSICRRGEALEFLSTSSSEPRGGVLSSSSTWPSGVYTMKHSCKGW